MVAFAATPLETLPRASSKAEVCSAGVVPPSERLFSPPLLNDLKRESKNNKKSRSKSPNQTLDEKNVPVEAAAAVDEGDDDNDVAEVEAMNEDEVGFQEPPVTYSISRTKQEARDQVMAALRQERERTALDMAQAE